MTDQQILEGNKLIAEFHGWQYYATPKGKGNGYWSFVEWGKANWDIESFKYHYSYDWLMPVFEKLRKVAYNIWDSDPTEQTPKLYLHVDIWQNVVHWIDEETGWYYLQKKYNSETGTLIENIFNAIIDFIHYYNQLEKK